jgi:hypothetical protein
VATADTQISVTVWIGVAGLGQHGHDLFELLAAADLALYRVKDEGRSKIMPRNSATGAAAPVVCNQAAMPLRQAVELISPVGPLARILL